MNYVNVAIGVLSICFGAMLVVKHELMLTKLVKFQAEVLDYHYGDLQKKVHI